MEKNVHTKAEDLMERNVRMKTENPMAKKVPMEIENPTVNVRITRIGNHTVIKGPMEPKDHTVKEILIVSPKRMETENHIVAIMKDTKIKSLCPFVILNMDTFIY